MILDPMSIQDLIELYFKMNEGEYIEDFLEEVLVFEKEITLKITRRTLKHIVEQRKRDAYSKNELKELFIDLTKILENKDYEIIQNQTNYKNNFLLVETIFDKKVGVVLVLEIVIFKDNSYFIKTGFYRATSKIKKLLKQK